MLPIYEKQGYPITHALTRFSATDWFVRSHNTIYVYLATSSPYILVWVLCMWGFGEIQIEKSRGIILGSVYVGVRGNFEIKKST